MISSFFLVVSFIGMVKGVGLGELKPARFEFHLSVNKQPICCAMHVCIQLLLQIHLLH